jgi:hypothetical protein
MFLFLNLNRSDDLTWFLVVLSLFSAYSYLVEENEPASQVTSFLAHISLYFIS